MKSSSHIHHTARTGRISAVVVVSSRFPKKSAPRFARSVGFTGDVSQLWEEVLPFAGLSADLLQIHMYL